jgi:TonB family protein
MKPSSRFRQRCAAFRTMPILTGIAAALLFAPTAFAQQQFTIPTFDKPVESLQQWDEWVTGLTRIGWMMSSVSGAGARDHLGRTPQQYYDENVLTPQIKQRLDELRAQADKQSAAGDDTGLKRSFAQATPLFGSEYSKSTALMSYVMAHTIMKRHLDTLQPWLDRASAAEKKAIAEHATAAYEALYKRFDEGLRVKTWTGMSAAGIMETAGGSIVYFNSERQRLVKQQEDLPNPIPFEPRKRVGECPAPTVPDAGNKNPSLAPDFPSSADFYPKQAEAIGLSGAVSVRASVSETGCIETVEIAQSSGSRELDEAALNLALVGRYRPGSEGDKAVPGSLVYRVKFEATVGPGRRKAP